MRQLVSEGFCQEGFAPDGFYAFQQALRAETAALSKYLDALREFQAALPSPPVSKQESGAEIREEDRLTPRERQVLTLIASGKSSKQIAAELGMAFRTAVCHRYRLYRKLRVHTSVELTRAALRMGLVDL